MYLKATCDAGKASQRSASRTWFYIPDAVTMSPVYRRGRNKSVSIKKYLTADRRRHLPIIWKRDYDYMETSPYVVQIMTGRLLHSWLWILQTLMKLLYFITIFSKELSFFLPKSIKSFRTVQILVSVNYPYTKGPVLV